MRLRYIILGVSLFIWSVFATELIASHFDLDLMFDRPVLHFVILASGILIGVGATKRG